MRGEKQDMWWEEKSQKQNSQLNLEKEIKKREEKDMRWVVNKTREGDETRSWEQNGMRGDEKENKSRRGEWDKQRRKEKKTTEKEGWEESGLRLGENGRQEEEKKDMRGEKLKTQLELVFKRWRWSLFNREKSRWKDTLNK